MEPKTELTRDEMREKLAQEILGIYGMSIAEYLEAKRSGNLPYHPALGGLEVFSGEAAGRDAPEGEDAAGSNGALAFVYAATPIMYQSSNAPLFRALTARRKQRSNRTRSTR